MGMLFFVNLLRNLVITLTTIVNSSISMSPDKSKSKSENRLRTFQVPRALQLRISSVIASYQSTASSLSFSSENQFSMSFR